MKFLSLVKRILLRPGRRTVLTIGDYSKIIVYNGENLYFEGIITSVMYNMNDGMNTMDIKVVDRGWYQPKQKL